MIPTRHLAHEAETGTQYTILLVDDEQQVLEIAKRMIERIGYRVYAIARPDEALNFYRANASDIDCVMLDLTMPQIGGFELLAAIREIRRDQPAILCSGYADSSHDWGEIAPLTTFLPKPYRLDDLRRVLALAVEQLE
jgi:CheY-like chemotaxis protein